MAPPPTALQNFEYHWKQVKTFYTVDKNLPRIHMNDTNIPFHLEEMLRILIQEETGDDSSNGSNTKTLPPESECMALMLHSRPLDLLAELATADSPPGATVCILSWCRRFLSCLPNPRLDDESIFQPIQKLMLLCNGNRRSPYEEEEILFLLTVAGLIRKEPFLINLFLPTHQHSAYINARIKTNRMLQKLPIKNSLFDCSKVDANIRRVSIVHASGDTSSTTTTVVLADLPTTTSNCDTDDSAMLASNASSSVASVADAGSTGTGATTKKPFVCDCNQDDLLGLLETILGYFESADSMVVVRACEAALILASLPSVDMNCIAVNSSLSAFSRKNAKRLAQLCERIPDDMDTGDIEDYVVSWG